MNSIEQPGRLKANFLPVNPGKVPAAPMNV